MSTTSPPNAFPARWTDSTNARADLWDRIAAAGFSVLMLDYDGTLAPFQIDRLQALPWPGVEGRLKRLLEINTTRVVLVTGRSAREFQNMFPLSKQFELWAAHGREHITAEGKCQVFPVNDEQRAILDLVESALRGQVKASAIERKLASIAIHWRGFSRDQQASVEQRVLAVYRRHASDAGVELLPFEDGLELRATGRTKADAIQEILRPHLNGNESAPTAYLGDDRTDEDAFAALPPDGLGILVRTAPRPSIARYWLAPPDDLLSFLDGWTLAAAAEKTSMQAPDKEPMPEFPGSLA